MAITLTEAAASHVQNYLANNAGGVALKLAISTSGCSGYMYDLEFIDNIADELEVFESRGVKIAVDKLTLPLVDGTELDYRRDGLNEGFAFDNPNAKNMCGCGESFQV